MYKHAPIKKRKVGKRNNPWITTFGSNKKTINGIQSVKLVKLTLSLNGKAITVQEIIIIDW